MKKAVLFLMLAVLCLSFAAVAADDMELQPGMSALLNAKGYYLVGGDIPVGGYYISCDPEALGEDTWCSFRIIFSSFYYTSEMDGLSIDLSEGESYYFYLDKGIMLHTPYSPINLTVAEPITFK